MSIADLKYTEEELAAKSITALADRPALSAAEMKERLDSCDIRVKMNALIGEIDKEQSAQQEHLNRLLVFEKAEISAVLKALQIHGGETRFFAFFLSSGKMFCGTAGEMQQAIMNKEL